MKLRTFAVGALALALSLSGVAARAQSVAPPQPKLVVMIAIDQYAWSLFERYRASYSGGLKRLGAGRVFLGYQSHAATETCPGHSTLLTGDHPSRTGIVANSWFDRRTGSSLYCVGVPGTADPLARGPTYLKVDTLGDWLRAASPASRVVTVSAKDRAAIMLGGHHATGVYWWNDGLGFGTSPYAGPADAKALAPAERFNRQVFAAWKTAPPQLWPRDIPDQCQALAQPHQFGGLKISGAVPTEASAGVTEGPLWPSSAAFQAELRDSPLLDRLTLQFASQLVREQRLGQGAQPDVLAISLSSTDVVGHRYGAGGAEMCVQTLALDQALGDFLAALDRTGAPYVVALSADHGGIDAAERLGPPATRIDTGRLVGRLNAALKREFGFDYDPILGDDANQLILSLPPVDDRRRAEVLQAAIAWLKSQPEVADVFTPEQVAAARPPKGKPAADLTAVERFAESFQPDRSGDILVSYAEHATLGMPAAAGANVAGHGSAWDYDRQVPVIFWWPGVAPAQGEAAVETVDIAPTLASFLKVRAPDVDGRCLDLGQGCP